MDASERPGRTPSIWASALIGILLICVGMALLRVELTIRTTGQVYARDESRLYAPADGVIARHHATLGRLVRAGDVLIELDDTDLALREVQLERELAETDAALAEQAIARRELEVRPAPLEMMTAEERKTRLTRITAIQEQIEKSYSSGHDQQIISELELRRQEIEKLRAEMDLLQTSILADWQKAGLPELSRARLDVEQQRLETMRKLAQRELDLVNAQRDAMQVKAPMNGQVVSLNTRFIGMAVARGEELMKIAPTSGPFLVMALVPERNVDLLKEGTAALMESHVFDSMLEGSVHGTVQRIAPEAAGSGLSTNPAPARYEVDIAVSDSPYPLVLGSRLDVRLLLGRRSLAEVLFRSARNLRASAQGST